MNTNIDQHINWAKENSHIALDGFPIPRVTQRSASHPNIDNVVYDFQGKIQLEALYLESSSSAAASKQSRTGAACLSVVGLQELQKCQAVGLQFLPQQPPAQRDCSLQRIVLQHDLALFCFRFGRDCLRQVDGDFFVRTRQWKGRDVRRGVSLCCDGDLAHSSSRAFVFLQIARLSCPTIFKS
jgi:hypothetical protein